MKFCVVNLSLSCDRSVPVHFLTVIIGFILTTTLIQATMASNQEILTGNAQLANEIYEVLSKNDGNVFFSPISLHAALSLAYQGTAGETSTRMGRLLHVTETKSCADGYKAVMQDLNNVPNVTLHIANKVYIKDGYVLKQAFKDVATQSFSSEVDSVNFADSIKAAKTINTWVENKTNNKIKDLITPDKLDALTRLVLINAIYFKGNWANKFDASLTRKEPFYLNAQDKIDVPMMHITKKFHYGINDDLGAQILQMPYENEALSLVVILPNERDGIKELEKKLAKFDLTTITNNLYNTEVQVSLPKFKIETTIDFKDVLQQLGLEIIFGNKADFSNLLESPEQLYVSDIIQKAFIEVNEEGAEAAAATAMMMMVRCMPIVREKEFFVADHPFITMLVHVDEDGNGKTLFLGKVHHPKY